MLRGEVPWAGAWRWTCTKACVSFCAVDLGPAFGFMLLGLSFVEHFTTTLDFDRRRALFRAHEERRELRVPG